MFLTDTRPTHKLWAQSFPLVFRSQGLSLGILCPGAGCYCGLPQLKSQGSPSSPSALLVMVSELINMIIECSIRKCTSGGLQQVFCKFVLEISSFTQLVIIWPWRNLSVIRKWRSAPKSLPYLYYLCVHLSNFCIIKLLREDDKWLPVSLIKRQCDMPHTLGLESKCIMHTTESS